MNCFKDFVVGVCVVDFDDVDVYDLIFKDKECFFFFVEFIWFIFLYLVLCEGWDNLNVFVMCMLKYSDNIIFWCQEVGCGLWLSVD